MKDFKISQPAQKAGENKRLFKEKGNASSAPGVMPGSSTCKNRQDVILPVGRQSISIIEILDLN